MPYWERSLRCAQTVRLSTFMHQYYGAFLLRRFGIDSAIDLYERYHLSELSPYQWSYYASLLTFTPDGRDEARRTVGRTPPRRTSSIPILLGDEEAARDSGRQKCAAQNWMTRKNTS